MKYNELAQKEEFGLLAKLAAEAEGNGDFKTQDKINCILESYNRCQLCGAEQFFDEEYYKRTGIQKCSQCN